MPHTGCALFLCAPDFDRSAAWTFARCILRSLRAFAFVAWSRTSAPLVVRVRSFGLRFGSALRVVLRLPCVLTMRYMFAVPVRALPSCYMRLVLYGLAGAFVALPLPRVIAVDADLLRSLVHCVRLFRRSRSRCSFLRLGFVIRLLTPLFRCLVCVNAVRAGCCCVAAVPLLPACSFSRYGVTPRLRGFLRVVVAVFALLLCVRSFTDTLDDLLVVCLRLFALCLSVIRLRVVVVRHTFVVLFPLLLLLRCGVVCGDFVCAFTCVSCCCTAVRYCLLMPLLPLPLRRCLVRLRHCCSFAVVPVACVLIVVRCLFVDGLHCLLHVTV